MSIGNLKNEENYVLCIGLPLEVCSEVARSIGDHAVVVAAADTDAAWELLGGERTKVAGAAGEPGGPLPSGDQATPATLSVGSARQPAGSAQLEPAPPPTSRPMLTHGPLRVNLATREVTIAGRRVHLSVREFDLLAALASETDRVWSFAELTANVWRTGYLGDSNVVVSTVKRLRKRLTGVGGLEVASVRGIGYRLLIAS